MDISPQEHQSGANQRGTVSLRDIASIWADNAKGGSSNPEYSKLIALDVSVEIQQVSGGEVIRGKQIEAVAGFVVSLRHLEGLKINTRHRLVVGSGPYKDLELFLHRVHVVTQRSRPEFMMLHCKSEG